MTIQRMDNVGIVVDDLDAVIAFFVRLGMELEGTTLVEGRWAARVVGLHDQRVDVAMMRTHDHGRIELVKYHTPTAMRGVPEDAPANTLGHSPDHLCRRRHRPPAHPGRRTRRRGGAVRVPTGSATSAAPGASSSRWPKSSANARRRPTGDPRHDPLDRPRNRPWKG